MFAKHLGTGCVLATGFLLGSALMNPAYAEVVGVRIAADGSAGSLPISSSAVQWGARFTASETITIDQALARLTGSGGSPNLQVAIQADDGSGNPDGVDLGVATLGSSAGFNAGNFAAPVSLVQGNVYHFIHRVDNAGGGNSVFLASAPGVVFTAAPSGVAESQYALTLSQDSGSTWTTYTDKIMFGLRDSVSGAAIGQPYDGQTFVGVGGTSWRGQSFTVTGFGGDATLSEVSMKVYKDAAPAADDLRVYLIDTTTNDAVWSDVLMGASAGATGPTGDEVFVEVPDLTLVDGRQYILATESAGSAASAYSLYVASTQAPDEWLTSLNYQEAQGSTYLFADSAGLPGSFASLDNDTARFDAFFSLDLTAVPEPGTLLLLVAGSATLIVRRRSASEA